MRNYDLLINLTGGLDSTFAAWDYLINNPKGSLLIHHCILKNYQMRNDKEAESVHKILEYFQNTGLKNFDYIETEFSTKGLTHGINDIEVIGFLNSCIIRSNSIRCEHIAITASAQDLKQGASYEVRSKSRFDIIKLVSRTEPNYIWPIKDLTRTDMLLRLPDELKKLLWFCRTPTAAGNPCGKCKTCRWTLPYIKE